jgi:hypothetical protein
MNTVTAMRHPLASMTIVVLVLASLIPIGVTVAQSGEDYRLTNVPSPAAVPAGEGVSSGGAYVLSTIETWNTAQRSWGHDYFLAPLSPEEPEANICVYVPVVLKDR